MDVAKSQLSQPKPHGLLCWCPFWLNLCLSDPSSLHPSIALSASYYGHCTISSVPHKGKSLLLKSPLSLTQQQRSPPKKEQRLFFALGLELEGNWKSCSIHTQTTGLEDTSRQGLDRFL